MTCSVDTSFIGIFLSSAHDLQHSQARVTCSYTKNCIEAHMSSMLNQAKFSSNIRWPIEFLELCH